MNKEWFSARELIGVPSLPTTTQGIHARARRENWCSRRRLGVQGKAIEYSADSIPGCIFDYLSDDINRPNQKNIQENFTIWVDAFKQLSTDERKKFTEYILREGIMSIYKKI